MDFHKYAEHGHAFLKEVARELGRPDDLPYAGRVLRAVLHTLRNRLTPGEAIDLAAQLPVALKGVYFDGWKLGASPDRDLRTVADFVEEMRFADARDAFDFPHQEDAADAARHVFRVLKRHVSLGESRDVGAQLPKALRQLWNEA